MDLAAEQVRELAADRETQAGSSVLSAGAGVGLHEGLEDDLLLLGRNADAGVGDLEGDHRGCLLEHRVLRAPAALRAGDVEPHAALRGELEGVGQQVLEHLLQALRVGRDGASQIGIEIDLERQLPRFGLVPERTRDHVDEIGEDDLLGVDRDGSGFDLGQVENVADQVQQVGAGAVDGAGEVDLLGGEVAVRVVGELLAQDENAVERRAQLVRHVGEEFRLVLRGQRELGGLFLQRAARLLDFLILALDLDVALGQLLRFLLELLVGLLQLALLRLQFAGELLRLLEQTFGLHRRLDAVEHDADIGRELLEEHHLQGGEFARARRARSPP